METLERRQALKEYLSRASKPVSATVLARRFDVSRQIIVGDVALLRAGGMEILATPKGYVLPRQGGITFTVACTHRPEEMREELECMVDLGCTVLDVIVEHPIYGQLCGQLHLSSRQDVEQFIKKSERMGAKPLSMLTSGLHLHTLQCPTLECKEQVIAALKERKMLYEPLTQ